jgi:hypothetical protein
MERLDVASLQIDDLHDPSHNAKSGNRSERHIGGKIHSVQAIIFFSPSVFVSLGRHRQHAGTESSLRSAALQRRVLDATPPDDANAPKPIHPTNAF